MATLVAASLVAAATAVHPTTPTTPSSEDMELPPAPRQYAAQRKRKSPCLAAAASSSAAAAGSAVVVASYDDNVLSAEVMAQLALPIRDPKQHATLHTVALLFKHRFRERMGPAILAVIHSLTSPHFDAWAKEVSDSNDAGQRLCLRNWIRDVITIVHALFPNFAEMQRHWILEIEMFPRLALDNLTLRLKNCNTGRYKTYLMRDDDADSWFPSVFYHIAAVFASLRPRSSLPNAPLSLMFAIDSNDEEFDLLQDIWRLIPSHHTRTRALCILELVGSLEQQCQIHRAQTPSISALGIQRHFTIMKLVTGPIIAPPELTQDQLWHAFATVLGIINIRRGNSCQRSRDKYGSNIHNDDPLFDVEAGLCILSHLVARLCTSSETEIETSASRSTTAAAVPLLPHATLAVALWTELAVDLFHPRFLVKPELTDKSMDELEENAQERNQIWTLHTLRSPESYESSIAKRIVRITAGVHACLPAGTFTARHMLQHLAFRMSENVRREAFLRIALNFAHWQGPVFTGWWYPEEQETLHHFHNEFAPFRSMACASSLPHVVAQMLEAPLKSLEPIASNPRIERQAQMDAQTVQVDEFIETDLDLGTDSEEVAAAELAIEDEDDMSYIYEGSEGSDGEDVHSNEDVNEGNDKAEMTALTAVGDYLASLTRSLMQKVSEEEEEEDVGADDDCCSLGSGESSIVSVTEIRQLKEDALEPLNAATWYSFEQAEQKKKEEEENHLSRPAKKPRVAEDEESVLASSSMSGVRVIKVVCTSIVAEVAASSDDQDDDQDEPHVVPGQNLVFNVDGAATRVGKSVLLPDQLGLLAEQDISTGQLVTWYTGRNFLSLAAMYRHLATKPEAMRHYALDVTFDGRVRYFIDGSEPDPRFGGDEICSGARINHHPENFNTKFCIMKVRGCSGPFAYRVAIVTTAPIKAGNELLVHYGAEFHKSLEASDALVA